MVNSKRVLKEIELNQQELEASEVVSKIFLIKEKIEEKPVDEWNMNALVDYVFTLCKIMSNLSDLRDFAYIKTEALEEEYKSTVRDKYLALKESGVAKTDTMAKSLAEKESDSIKEEALKAKHQARWLKSLYDDCDRLISFTQTKVKGQSESFVRANIERK